MFLPTVTFPYGVFSAVHKLTLAGARAGLGHAPCLGFFGTRRRRQVSPSTFTLFSSCAGRDTRTMLATDALLEADMDDDDGSDDDELEFTCVSC